MISESHGNFPSPGAIHQNIDFPECVDDLISRFHEKIVVCYIGGKSEYLNIICFLKPLLYFGKTLLVNIKQGHPGAVKGKPVGDSRSNSAGSAGYDCNFIF